MREIGDNEAGDHDWPRFELDAFEVEDWVKRMAGPDVLADKRERADRVLEEAIELHRATYKADQAHYADDTDKTAFAKLLKIANAEYDKPVGTVEQEVAGVMVTMMAYARAAKLDLTKLTKDEIHRIQVDIGTIRQKQAAKAVRGTALAPTVKDKS